MCIDRNRTKPPSVKLYHHMFDNQQRCVTGFHAIDYNVFLYFFEQIQKCEWWHSKNSFLFHDELFMIPILVLICKDSDWSVPRICRFQAPKLWSGQLLISPKSALISLWKVVTAMLQNWFSCKVYNYFTRSGNITF